MTQRGKREVVLNVVLYSYLDRPIFDVMLDGTDIGIASAYGGNGMITGVSIPFGNQIVTWKLGGPRGMARNGETVRMKNSLGISSDQVSSDIRYLGLHIYPDDTVEITFDKYIPDVTPRGRKLIEESGRNGK